MFQITLHARGDRSIARPPRGDVSMDRFRLPNMLKEAVKASPVPFAIYEFASQKVKTVALSQGFYNGPMNSDQN